MLMNRSLMSRAVVLAIAGVVIVAGCGGGSASLDCVESAVPEQFIATTPLSALGFDLEGDPPVPADAEIVESSAAPDGDSAQVVLSTTEALRELYPVYSSAFGGCPEFGTIDDGDVQTWQARDGDTTLRVHFEEGLLTITESTG
jgi:hypothetical protein